MPKSNWKIRFYAASTDYATVAYTRVPKTTLAAYTGLTSIDAYIVAPQNTKDVHGEILTDISGWEESNVTMRDVFDVELYPFTYNATSDPDLDDWDSICAFITGANKLWCAIEAGGRTYPPTSTDAMPVILESISESVNKSAGAHNVNLKLRVKGLR